MVMMRVLAVSLLVFLFSVGRCGEDLSRCSSSTSDRCCLWSNRRELMVCLADRLLWRWGRPPDVDTVTGTVSLCGRGCHLLDPLTVKARSGMEALQGGLVPGVRRSAVQQRAAAVPVLCFGVWSCLDWVPISNFWVPSIRLWAWGQGWLWARDRAQWLGLISSHIWIWDPGGALGTYLLKCVGIISGVLCLSAGRLLIAIFYKRSQYNHAVSTTIACLASSVNCAGTNMVLRHLPISCMPELQILMIWSPNLKVMTMISLLVIILRRQGIYLQFSVSLSISDLEQYLIVHELLVGVVHLLVCSSLALASSRLWLVSAPKVFRDAILNDCNR